VAAVLYSYDIAAVGFYAVVAHNLDNANWLNRVVPVGIINTKKVVGYLWACRINNNVAVTA